MLRQVAYSSLANAPITSGVLADLAAGARRFNAAHHVSGLLLCDGRRFLQLIEGAPEDVSRCLDRIRADRTHRLIEILGDSEAAERAFGGWALQCRRLGGDDAAAHADFLGAVKSDVAQVADCGLRALFIGFAVIGRR